MVRGAVGPDFTVASEAAIPLMVGLAVVSAVGFYFYLRARCQPPALERLARTVMPLEHPEGA